MKNKFKEIHYLVRFIQMNYIITTINLNKMLIKKVELIYSDPIMVRLLTHPYPTI